MGASASGARDANGFHAAVRCGMLPDVESMTYQGVFNEHAFQAGPPEKERTLAVSAHVAWAPSSGPAGDDEAWVGCFLKSAKDGQPRGARLIDLVLVLDVSGSMSCGVESAKPGRTRLELAKEALLSLFGSLRDDDRFGLASFNTVGTTLQPLARKQEVDLPRLSDRVAGLVASGGTTLQAGIEAAAGILATTPATDAARGAGAAAPPRQEEASRERRLVLVTDMHDLDSAGLAETIGVQAKLGLHCSFVCIGVGFNAALAEEVTKHKGASYHCVTRDEELRKVLMEDFAWNFFPAAFDVELSFQTGDYDMANVYGTPFDTEEEQLAATWRPETHAFYPAEVRKQTESLLLCAQRAAPKKQLPLAALEKTLGCLAPQTRMLTRVDTCFPSAVRPDGAVEGGLILLCLRPKKAAAAAGGGSSPLKLILSYTDAEDGAPNPKLVEQELCLDLIQPPKDTPSDAKSSSAELMSQARLLQRYVEVCRGYLATAAESQQVAAVRAPKDGGRIAQTNAAKEKENQRLADVEGLCAELKQPGHWVSEAAKLCPGVPESLERFAQMAKECSKPE